MEFCKGTEESERVSESVSESVPPFDSSIHLFCFLDNKNEAKAAVDVLRKKIVENIADYDTEFCSDHQLMLFLQARGFDIDQAFQMILETFEWRAFRQPHNLHKEEGWWRFLENETVTGKIYNPGLPLMIL